MGRMNDRMIWEDVTKKDLNEFIAPRKGAKSEALNIVG